MQKLTRVVNSSIRMGEMSVAADGEELRTLLGSCIGLALYDRQRKVGGLAHIVLPNTHGATDLPGKSVDKAIPRLIKDIEQLVAHLVGQVPHHLHRLEQPKAHQCGAQLAVETFEHRQGHRQLALGDDSLGEQVLAEELARLV